MMPVAILCGGLGTRLKPLTDDKPKYLVDVGGRPFAQRQLELLKHHGYTNIVLLTGYLGKAIQAAVGDGSQCGVHIRYSSDGILRRGTAGAVLQALPMLADEFFVLYGDSYLDCDYRAIEKRFIEADQTGLVTTYRGIDYGLSAFRRARFNNYATKTPSLNVARELMRLADDLIEYPVEQPFIEVGSPDGLAALRGQFE